MHGLPLAEVTHELRAPLGGIEAMAQLLAETDLTPDQRRLVEGLLAAAGHLRSVATDILDGSALRAGHLSFEEAPMDLRRLVADIAISAEARTRAKGLAFALEIDDTIAESVQADGRRIRQMLENLIDNAMKVTLSGSITLSISPVDRRGAFEGLRFAVTDTGPGLSAEDSAKIFRSFGKLDNGHAGTGIGLSMVKRLAHAMGGEAGCESQPGQTTTFWFTLRLKLDSFTQPCPMQVPPLDEPGGNAMPSSGRILVVDDNLANRMIMGAMLEHFGFEMAEAASAEQALAMVVGGGFDAVMMDQTMHGMSGVEALRLIRAMPEPARSIPVIPVTGRVGAQDRAAFAKAGATGFIEKPLTARAVREGLTKAGLVQRAAL
jgi:CheY-like chemotaxis protein